MNKKDLDALAYRIYEMGLGSVGIFFLESMKPLNNVAFNLGLFSKPFAEVFLKEEVYERILDVIKDKDALEYIITKLEELEDGNVDSRAD